MREQPDDRLVGVHFNAPLDLLRQFDANCKRPEVDSDRTKMLRRLMREFNAKHEQERAA